MTSPETDDTMRPKAISIAAASAAVLVSGIFCSSGNSIISDNIANAEIQTRLLLEASEAGDTIRIPSSFQKGEVVFVPASDWVSGFFAGTLWYMYELTGDEFWAEHARKHTEALEDIQYLTWHHDVGFMIYDSYGNGLRLKNIEGYKDVCINAAKSLSTRFRPGAGILQSWNADSGWQSERGWKCPVIIDNMMNLEILFKATEFSGDPTFARIAASHADKTLENHFRPEGSCYHVVDYDPETGDVLKKCTAQGYADESAWSRGQAWALYGFTAAYRFTADNKCLIRICRKTLCLTGISMPRTFLTSRGTPLRQPSLLPACTNCIATPARIYTRKRQTKSSVHFQRLHTGPHREPTEVSSLCIRWEAYPTATA